jgi:tetratricopeptide (TPR) repeat protein
VAQPQYAGPRERLLAAIGLHQKGHLVPAICGYREVLAAEPCQFDALRLLGVALLASDRPAEALAALDRAVSVRSNMAEVWEQRGKALAQLGRNEDACDSFGRALQFEPARVSSIHHLGLRLNELRRFEEALVQFDRALAIQPELPEVWANRGKVLHDLKRNDEAIASFDRALALRPDFAPAWTGRVSPLRELGRIEDALQSCERALAADGSNPTGWALRGALLAELTRHQEAISSFDQADRLGPAHATTHFNRGLLHLTLGRFDSGWQGYEWRLKVPEMAMAPVSQAPMWDGTAPVAGRTLLLTCEQGLGDTIQFCRYAPWLAQHRQARVAILAPASLRELMRTLPQDIQVISDGDPMPAFDLQCPLLSIPHRLNTALDSIVAQVPYLRADPARVSAWAQRLGPARARRIGLVCSGNPKHGNDRNRSIALARLAPLCQAGVELHLVQKDLRQDDEAALQALGIVDHREQLHDFADTAALLACLDLVISVDTSVAHLAGALGVPLWLLLPASADWRWLLQRQDSPWYPSARLFRQPHPGDWDQPIANMHRQLLVRAPMATT